MSFLSVPTTKILHINAIPEQGIAVALAQCPLDSILPPSDTHETVCFPNDVST